ncbi:MAG TPA: ABC transporter permease [Verrucomicrobiae bacterium]|nr:ABC transporter permease [Verrucomicrobiae bacterium]
MRTVSREGSVAAALAVVLLGLAGFAPSFYQPMPLLSLAAREAPALVVTCGMALIIVSRQIDISVGSQFAVCSVCTGLLLAAHYPPALVLVACLLVGALLGGLNGALVAGLQLPSIVVTLATMVSLREALRWQRQGQFVNLPPTVQWFGLSQTHGQILIVSVAVLILTVLAWAAKYLAAGRYVYAIGSNLEAARLAGVPPRALTFAVFVLLGALNGIAALLNSVQSLQVDPKSGTGLELKAIAAAVVGGIAINGGRGNLWGAALGLGLLACISPALVFVHLEPYWERAIQGLIILLAVMADGLPVRRRRLGDRPRAQVQS